MEHEIVVYSGSNKRNEYGSEYLLCERQVYIVRRDFRKEILANETLSFCSGIRETEFPIIVIKPWMTVLCC